MTKLGAGLLAGSTAMISEGVHSISDVANELFLVTSVRRSERPPDSRHPFGHGAERFFWSFMAAVGIFLTGGMFSLFGRTRPSPEPPGTGRWALEYGVLGLAAALEGASGAGHAPDPERGGVSSPLVLGTRGEEPGPSVKTVAREDLIAVVGLVIAAVGIGLHQLTGNGRWEGVASGSTSR